MVAESSSAVAPICSAIEASTLPVRADSAARASSCAAVCPCSSDFACSWIADCASVAALACSSAALATITAPFSASPDARSASTAAVSVSWLAVAIVCMSVRSPSSTLTAATPAFDSLNAISAADCNAAATSRTSDWIAVASFWTSWALFSDVSASERTSSATTAKPRP